MIDGPLTLGTAGHIDHGKTALIEALTGVNTDRLPEEKARGISISLGYALLRLPTGRTLSVIDVPGHERFVRTMVAGATGIDLFLMVIAADDGVMPQTIEHKAVLDGLGIEHGVVAVTKADLLDPGPATEEARELLPGCTAVPCSAQTRAGLSELLAALGQALERCRSRALTPGHVVLHVDRVFTVAGHGTVVTGTLWSGTIRCGDTLELLPQATAVRARALEVHDAPRETVQAGQRVAVNITGIKARVIERGNVLATPTTLRETTTLDCSLRLGDQARHALPVHVHHGTREAPGRLVHLADNFWQLRLELPIFAANGDRIVIRRSSPAGTLGGGLVLDAHARRHSGRADALERLRRMRDGKPDEPSPLVRAEPTKVAVQPPSEPSDSEKAQMAIVEQRLREAWSRPLSAEQLEASPVLLNALRAEGLAVRVGGRLYAHVDAVAAVQASAIELIEHEGAVTLARLRDALGISRKSAQVLLEHLDSTLVTRRLDDDSRVLGSSRRR